MTGMEDRFAPPPRFADASDGLHELVARQTGCDDFGPEDYLPGLQVLLLAMDFDPRFTEQGRRIAWGELVSALAARAQAVRSMRQAPGVDDHPLERPIVITGIPRTGTTALHKLMAVDDRFQGLQTWLIAAPMPRPPRPGWESQPLFAEAVERLEARHGSLPDLRAAHAEIAEEVDECLGLLRLGFVSNFWNCPFSVPSYTAWWQLQSEEPSYRFYRRTLQLIGSTEPDKRWLLKNPGHVAHLDLVFAMFPDAAVIQTHRDPAKAIPSLCALLAPIHPLMETTPADIQARLLGIRETEKWAAALRAAEPVRQSCRGQILDVIHADFHRQPMATIERIYAFIGMELTSDVRAAMLARIEAKPELSHGAHRYHLADFGLSEGTVRERFGDYVQRYDLVEKR